MQQAMIAGFSRHHPAMATAVVSPKPAWWRYVRHEQARICGPWRIDGSQAGAGRQRQAAKLLGPMITHPTITACSGFPWASNGLATVPLAPIPARPTAPRRTAWRRSIISAV